MFKKFNSFSLGKLRFFSHYGNYSTTIGVIFQITTLIRRMLGLYWHFSYDVKKVIGIYYRKNEAFFTHTYYITFHDLKNLYCMKLYLLSIYKQSQFFLIQVVCASTLTQVLYSNTPTPSMLHILLHGTSYPHRIPLWLCICPIQPFYQYMP